MKQNIFISIATIILAGCTSNNQFDATGTFEATEIVVSAESTGKIISLQAEEGTTIEVNAELGVIDSIQLHLQRKQLIAQQSALLSSRPDIQTQVSSLREQIAKQHTELARTEKLLDSNAATEKQLDDIKAQIRVLEKQLDATLSTLSNNTATINDNVAAIDAQIASLNDRIAKCRITSPIDGTILVKYAEPGEFTTVGKPLFKIADLDNIYLRAYFTSDQLSKLKLGDNVTVTADFGGNEQIDYEGTISWIASDSEFTPKTIQTKDSRANLVYAVKIAVKNDGKLKIGLQGEVKLH